MTYYVTCVGLYTLTAANRLIKRYIHYDNHKLQL